LLETVGRALAVIRSAMDLYVEANGFRERRKP